MKKKPPPSPDELAAAVLRFGGRDVRGSAVMAVAWLDDALELCLHNYLSRDEKLAKEMLRPDGPLGTFSARIKLTYLVGLIPDPVRRDLDLLRTIRNDFAHVRTQVSFTDQSIKDRCDRLNTYQIYSQYYGDDRRRSAKTKFVLTASFLTAALLELATLTPLPEPDADFITSWIHEALALSLF